MVLVWFLRLPRIECGPVPGAGPRVPATGPWVFVERASVPLNGVLLWGVQHGV